MYLSVLFLAVNAMNTVLALFEFERNMFYRHKAAGMYNARAVVLGFTITEMPYIFAAGTLFTMIFYWTLKFRAEWAPFLWFWAFVVITLACFTCIGQMLIACLRDTMTAQGFGSLIVMGSSLFGGILLRPDQIPPFWM
jgi:ATP-binding cassette, subfamily G (WHITE), member 2, SNQ2